MRKAADLVVEEAKPVEMDRAEAREKLWTPEGEGRPRPPPGISGPPATTTEPTSTAAERPQLRRS